MRGVTRTVSLDVQYLGEWNTPFWVGDENRGELRTGTIQYYPEAPPAS